MKYLALVGLFLIAPFAHAAIAFDTSVTGANALTTSPVYYTFTPSGTDTAVCVENAGAVQSSDPISAVEIGTAVSTSTMTKEGGAQAPSDRYNDFWCIVGSYSGTQTIKVTFSGSFLISLATAYSGVASIDAPITSTGSAVTSLTLTTNTTVNNAWTASGAHNSNGTMIAGTNLTIRQNPAGQGVGIGDSNAAIASAGSASLQWKFGSASAWAGTIVALEPVVPATATSILGLVRAFWI